MSDTWTKYHDENGNEYYYNESTEETRWELPENAIAVDAQSAGAPLQASTTETENETIVERVSVEPDLEEENDEVREVKEELSTASEAVKNETEEKNNNFAEEKEIEISEEKSKENGKHNDEETITICSYKEPEINLLSESAVIVVPDHVRIRECILEYLDYHEYIHTVDCFKAESQQLEIKNKRINTIIHDEEAGENSELRHILKAQILRAYDSGDGERLFNFWRKHVPNKVLQESPIASRLEFHLRIHVSIFALREENSDKPLNDETQQQRMTAFKEFLNTSGHRLAQSHEFCPFYALPFAENPKDHPSFKNLFNSDWVEDLRSRLIGFLDIILEPYQVPELCKMFSGKRELLNYEGSPKKKEKENDLSHERAFDFAKSLYVTAVDLMQRLEDIRCIIPQEVEHIISEEYMNLILQRMDEFGTVFETGMLPVEEDEGDIADADESKEGKTDIDEREENEKRESKFDNEETAQSLQPLSVETKYEFIPPDIGKEKPVNSPTSPTSPAGVKDPFRSPTELPIMPELDYMAIKEDLTELAFMTSSDKGASRHCCLILQALRWRLSRTPPWKIRQKVITSYTTSDVLGCLPKNDEKEEGLIFLLLHNEVPLVVEYTCRLLNYVASHSRGRDYLLSNQSLLNSLHTVIEAQQDNDTATLQNTLGIIQKLSLRKEAAHHLIDIGILELIVFILSKKRDEPLCDYSTDFAMALLMNLTLRPYGKDRAEKHALNGDSCNILLLLKKMLKSGCSLMYVNGTLYSLFTRKAFRTQALSASIDIKTILLDQVHREDISDQFRKQMNYIIQQLEENDAQVEDEDETGPADEEIDNDEEIELEAESGEDEHPSMQVLGNNQDQFSLQTEMSGERLLVHFYMVEAAARFEGADEGEIDQTGNTFITPVIQTNKSPERKRSPIFRQQPIPEEMISRPRLIRSRENQQAERL